MSSSSGFTSSGDRYALVTGAGRGIGRACALTLARMGIYVAATARTESELLSLQEEIDPLVPILESRRKARMKELGYSM